MRNLGEGASKCWKFERGFQQVEGSLSEGSSRWWGISASVPAGGGKFE